mgnify:FL=1
MQRSKNVVQAVEASGGPSRNLVQAMGKIARPGFIDTLEARGHSRASLDAMPTMKLANLIVSG